MHPAFVMFNCCDIGGVLVRITCIVFACVGIALYVKIWRRVTTHNYHGWLVFSFRGGQAEACGLRLCEDYECVVNTTSGQVDDPRCRGGEVGDVTEEWIGARILVASSDTTQTNRKFVSKYQNILVASLLCDRRLEKRHWHYVHKIQSMMCRTKEFHRRPSRIASVPSSTLWSCWFECTDFQLTSTNYGRWGKWQTLTFGAGEIHFARELEHFIKVKVWSLVKVIAFRGQGHRVYRISDLPCKYMFILYLHCSCPLLYMYNSIT